jgi:hypothetical protein
MYYTEISHSGRKYGKATIFAKWDNGQSIWFRSNWCLAVEQDYSELDTGMNQHHNGDEVRRQAPF